MSQAILPLRSHYDVVVVGARCAGAATAMLLARQGAAVLAVDRSSYGADALSTHALMRPGVVQLHRWGLLDHVALAGTPPIRQATFVYGEREIGVPIRARGGIDALFAPRRTVLDRILVDAARNAGADVRHRVDVVDLVRGPYGRIMGVELVDREGQLREVSAGIVIGADGIRSRVADRAGATTYRTCRHATALVFGYWSGLEARGYQWLHRPGIAGGVVPTNGGESCVFVAVPPERFLRWSPRDLEPAFMDAIAEVSPVLSTSLATAQRVGALRSFAGTPGFLRKASGSGWALVGDAGYFRDPITAHGMTDALRDAELLARAIARGTPGLDEYEGTRDTFATDILELSDAVASFAWDLDQLAALHDALHAAMKQEAAGMESFDTKTTAAA